MLTRGLAGIAGIALTALTLSFAYGEALTADASALKSELATKGWIAFSARGDNGTWDLMLCRPDGSALRNLTNTEDIEEAAPRFSPDGKRLLYRQMAKGAKIDHDNWGFQGALVVADADGSQPETIGGDGEFPWASWNPDGKQITCLTKKGIQVVDLASKKILSETPRKGLYQQLFASPDGKWLCGVANHMGESWTVVRMNVASGEVNAVRAFQNCTPDWHPDSQHVIFSSRPSGQKTNDGYGVTQLWLAQGDGQDARLLYAEEGFHIYGGALSPDAQYFLFTKSPKDGGDPEGKGAPMYVMRISDTPSIGGASPELRSLHPQTKDGPALELPSGWEPHWTYAEIGKGQ